MTNYLAYVEVGTARQIWPNTFEDTMYLTTISVQTAELPEMNKLNLDNYNGKAIVISGRANGSWIWSAKVKEVAGPLLSEMIKTIETKQISIHEGQPSSAQ